MRAPLVARWAAAAAVLFLLGCLPAAAQAPASPEQEAAIKPIMAPPAARAAKTTSARVASHGSKTKAKDASHVYLFRGLLNIFSLGMDELADKIRATGVAATVYNHTEWEEVAGKIVADYKNGNHGPIILIGHSLGADAVMFMGAYLGKQGVPVALIVPFDGTQTLTASSNVARVLNITQRDYAYVRKGVGFRGELQNMDVSSQGLDHLDIDKSPRLHALVLGKIAAVVKRGATPSEFATVPGEKETAKHAPKPAAAEAAAKPAEASAALPAGETAKPASVPAPAQPAAAGTTPAPASVSSPASAPSVSAASETAAAQPISAPAATAPQPASAPAPRPATERLEYEKLKE